MGQETIMAPQARNLNLLPRTLSKFALTARCSTIFASELPRYTLELDPLRGVFGPCKVAIYMLPILPILINFAS